MQSGTSATKWDVERAATELGVSSHTLRAWLRQRRLPYLKLGRRVPLDPLDVQQFLQANRVEAVNLWGSGSPNGINGERETIHCAPLIACSHSSQTPENMAKAGMCAVRSTAATVIPR